MSLILSFSLKDGKDCYFDVDGLYVTDNAISWDNVKLYIDYAPYDSSFETWSGSKLSDDDVFEQTINAYIRNDTSDYKSFGNEWSVFDPLFLNMNYDSSKNLMLTLPVIEFDEVVLYNLDMATPDYTFYSHNDSFKVFDANGGLVTDYENFFMSAMYEEYEDIINGKTECLYITPEVEEYLSED
jgi:hypothetical protein